MLRWLCLCLWLAGCAALPSTGPSASDIAEAPDDVARDFLVVDLDANVVRSLGATSRPSIRDILGGGGGAQPATLGVGDQLMITVWEAASDGLFSNITGKQTPIEVTVDQGREIFVPYAGKIDVAGLGVEEVRQAVADKLQGQAIDPQVQVALTSIASQSLTVVGHVIAPGQFAVPPAGIRLIEAVALAGGASSPSFETDVTVVRRGTRATVPLDRVLAGGGNNIRLGSGDVIEIQHRPRNFTAFGAVTAQNLQAFTTQDVSLAEALAQSGGLNDNLADAGGVFLFRYEAASRLSVLDRLLPEAPTGQGVPTVYRLDLSTPQAFFLASQFMMQNKDVLYVANAPATELQKFVGTILGPLLGSARSVETLGDQL